MARTSGRRLFFALWPPDELRTRIARATRAEVRGTGGKPTPFENLHITLHFAGSTPETHIAPLIERTMDLQPEPFELTLDHYGYWQRSRTLWMGVRETPPAMMELARDLARIARELGLPRQRRAFLPHMTLARKVNRLTPKDAPPPIKWTVEDFVLVNSELGGRHSRYVILEHFG